MGQKRIGCGRADAPGITLAPSLFTGIGWWAVALTGPTSPEPEEDIMTTIADAQIAALGSTPARPLSA
ncbi:hypothetical protein MHM582_0800 [Microbacterium sp. HM58-2]|nr:hypothetical protein MHM582_0800 [Microbacterium sp. HM58-2]